ncbi:MAG: arginine N-succinyltransferase, partial [Motiliproteus sp.]
LQLLSRARMLFMACHRHRFADRTLAELQGVLDEQLKSPFWEALGRHFFSMEFSRANYLTGIQSKSFIADLMPHYPVYVPLLPEAAQAVIAKPRPDIEPILTLLESEGFEARGYIDIFDAGPTLENRTDQIRSLRDSQLLTLVCGDALTGASADQSRAVMALVSNTELASFRCLLTRIDQRQPQLIDETAALLGVAQGAAVRMHPLAP